MATEPPKDPDGSRSKVIVLALLTLVSFAAIILVATQDQAPAAKEIAGAWAASCTVLVVIWKR